MQITMNAGKINSVNPIEHIYFNNLRKGKYQYFVYYHTKQLDGPTESDFSITVYDSLTQ